GHTGWAGRVCCDGPVSVEYGGGERFPGGGGRREAGVSGVPAVLVGRQDVVGVPARRGPDGDLRAIVVGRHGVSGVSLWAWQPGRWRCATLRRPRRSR